ncbi:hypothetical protein GCM10007972_25970 [Iodidimonas muriae]|uniref:Uncharacterized protein n=1 Tax=Iodidimonas muriae TaxID=261467 RepID=A0ABQ2LG86_9PROT|nr:hypothetical protein [Iodidimonas muriae]GER08539.1 hypothetical protein JCM17843_28490 [Kordiimonadales bacterium JCM 17843]GGO16647.1 hypothetical protein GCM10007972_25970 [Iodidimonas muriae]
MLNAYDPALPKDSIVAVGNRGQYLVVIPSLELVIVRRGYDMVGGSGFSYVDFASQIVAALKEN